MVDVTTAVRSASKYLKQVEEVLGSELENLRLEEVEKEEGTNRWSDHAWIRRSLCATARFKSI